MAYTMQTLAKVFLLWKCLFTSTLLVFLAKQVGEAIFQAEKIVETSGMLYDRCIPTASGVIGKTQLKSWLTAGTDRPTLPTASPSKCIACYFSEWPSCDPWPGNDLLSACGERETFSYHLCYIGNIHHSMFPNVTTIFGWVNKVPNCLEGQHNPSCGNIKLSISRIHRPLSVLPRLSIGSPSS